MQKFIINFEGYCIIKADTKEEAEKKFWEGLQQEANNSVYDIYDIYDIEEKKIKIT